MAALAPGARLLVARVFDAEGCASDGAVVDAMSWAASSGADALNLSLGGPGTSPPLEVAGIDADLLGAVPVAAAGNSGSSQLEYPAVYAQYLSVAATGYVEPSSSSEDPVAIYSTRNEGVDLAAPGGSNSASMPSHDILGACWVGAVEGRGYCRESGTSFAAPLVSAAVALARAIDPARTAVGVRELLTDTARDITAAPGTGPGRDDRTGYGRLDVARATAHLADRRDTFDDLPGTGTATAASVAASRAAFPQADARHVVIARDDVFADSLAGSALAGDDGPILMTAPSRLDPAVEAELRRVMPGGGRVWVLGGESAISRAVVDRITALGYSPLRLHGRSRIETSIAIARQVGRHPSGQVLVASAANWPDAIAGGLYAADRGVPLVLSWPDSAADERSAGVTTALRDLGARDIVLLGGDAALSGQVFAQAREVAPTRRVAGSTRFATATEIARQLWGRTGYAPGQSFVVVNGDRGNGWAMGLASAPLAARNDAPLLLVNDGLTTQQPATLPARDPAVPPGPERPRPAGGAGDGDERALHAGVHGPAGPGAPRRMSARLETRRPGRCGGGRWPSPRPRPARRPASRPRRPRPRCAAVDAAGLTQTVVPAVDGLSRVTVTTATFGETDGVDGVLELTVRAGDVERTTAAAGADLVDNAPVTLAFEPIPDSAGETVELTFRYAGAEPLALYLDPYDAYADGALTGGGDLTFSLGHRDRVGGALSAAGRVVADAGDRATSDPAFLVVWLAAHRRRGHADGPHPARSLTPARRGVLAQGVEEKRDGQGEGGHDEHGSRPRRRAAGRPRRRAVGPAAAACAPTRPAHRARR